MKKRIIRFAVALSMMLTVLPVMNEGGSISGGISISAAESAKTSDYVTIAEEKYKISETTSLSLVGDKLTNEDVKKIAKLKNLTLLSLDYNQISDITPLSKLTNLTNLYLYGNISDLKPLAKLTKLTELNLEKNNISDSDIKWLKKQLKNTNISA